LLTLHAPDDAFCSSKKAMRADWDMRHETLEAARGCAVRRVEEG
jgi:hypothetical protein